MMTIDPRIEWRFQMSAFLDSYVSRVLLAMPAPRSHIAATIRRWRGVSPFFFDPYRPELYYMRGPGPKWRAKRARCAHVI